MTLLNFFWEALHSFPCRGGLFWDKSKCNSVPAQCNSASNSRKGILQQGDRVRKNKRNLVSMFFDVSRAWRSWLFTHIRLIHFMVPTYFIIHRWKLGLETKLFVFCLRWKIIKVVNPFWSKLWTQGLVSGNYFLLLITKIIRFWNFCK